MYYNESTDSCWRIVLVPLQVQSNISKIIFLGAPKISMDLILLAFLPYHLEIFLKPTLVISQELHIRLYMGAS